MHDRAGWIASLHGLTAVASDWDALADQCGPFSEWGWYDAWWRAFGDGRPPEVCVVRREGELVAACPLYRDGRVLRGMANTQTPAFRPLALDAPALAALCDALRDAAPELELPLLPADEAAHHAIHRSVAAAGGLDHAPLHKRSPITDTTGDFAELRAQRKGQWRETERRARKAAREHDVRLALIERVDDHAALLQEGFELEARGWKGSSGTAILSSPATTAFFRGVADAYAARGELRFSTLRIDGRLAAFDLALVTRGGYHLLKTAFDESARSLSPGLVLRRAVIEECFGRPDVDAHEFLGVDTAWKRLFATRHRDHVRYRAWRDTPANRVRHAYRARMRPRARRAVQAWRARGG